MIENKEELDYIMIGLNDMVTGNSREKWELHSHLISYLEYKFTLHWGFMKYAKDVILVSCNRK